MNIARKALTGVAVLALAFVPYSVSLDSAGPRGGVPAIQPNLVCGQDPEQPGDGDGSGDCTNDCGCNGGWNGCCVLPNGAICLRS